MSRTAQKARRTLLCGTIILHKAAIEHGFLTTSYGKRIQEPVEPLCHCNSIIQMD